MRGLWSDRLRACITVISPPPNISPSMVLLFRLCMKWDPPPSPPAFFERQTLPMSNRQWGSSVRSPAHYVMTGSRWPSDKQRMPGGGMSIIPSPSAAVAAAPGDTSRRAPARNGTLSSKPEHLGKLSISDRWGKGGGQDSSNTIFWGIHGGAGLTRGQRIAVSHRHYDIRTAVEVLKRWPLPEKAVGRKMRQIIGARRGWTSV